jgi:hypothetical protein
MSEAVPRLLDLRAVAEMWSVSPHTIRRWVRQGRLRPLRICRKLLFHPDECVSQKSSRPPAIINTYDFRPNRPKYITSCIAEQIYLWYYNGCKSPKAES